MKLFYTVKLMNEHVACKKVLQTHSIYYLNFSYNYKRFKLLVFKHCLTIEHNSLNSLERWSYP